jgi:hypothetical protein
MESTMMVVIVVRVLVEDLDEISLEEEERE